MWKKGSHNHRYQACSVWTLAQSLLPSQCFHSEASLCGTFRTVGTYGIAPSAKLNLCLFPVAPSFVCPACLCTCLPLSTVSNLPQYLSLKQLQNPAVVASQIAVSSSLYDMCSGLPTLGSDKANDRPLRCSADPVGLLRWTGCKPLTFILVTPRLLASTCQLAP